MSQVPSENFGNRSEMEADEDGSVEVSSENKLSVELDSTPLPFKNEMRIYSSASLDVRSQTPSVVSSSYQSTIQPTVYKTKGRRTEQGRLGGVPRIPGRPRRWTLKRQLVGRIQASVWCEVVGSEDPCFLHNVSLLQNTLLSKTTRRRHRETRSSRFFKNGTPAAVDEDVEED
jgi:hypothetical protein